MARGSTCFNGTRTGTNGITRFLIGCCCPGCELLPTAGFRGVGRMDVADRRVQVRQANSSIANAAREAEFVHAVPFICECGETGCPGFARLAVDAFEIVATQPDWYLIGDAHGFRAAVMNADAVVVELPSSPQAPI